MNTKVKLNISKQMFSNEEKELLTGSFFKVSSKRFPGGVRALTFKTEAIELTILPFKGHQIWNFKIDGQDVTQKSIFPYPLNNSKFGDNYGGFLYHCGLTNINGAGEGEDYPLHGELPFAEFENNQVSYGVDDKSSYISFSGDFTYRNSQEYNYTYSPELIIRENSKMLEYRIQISNHRQSNFNYVFMCHMNWLGIDGAKFIYTADTENVKPIFMEAWDCSERAKRIENFSKKAIENPEILDCLEPDSQVLDPEYCVNIKYNSDDLGYAHSLMVLPNNESYYVSFNTAKLPYGLRWFCRTGDEDGIGFCLPTTGSNGSTKEQYKNGTFNSLGAKSSDSLHFYFGKLNKEDTNKKIEMIRKLGGRI